MEVGGLAPRTGSSPADEGAGPPGEFSPLTPPEWSGPEVAADAVSGPGPSAPPGPVGSAGDVAVSDRGSESLGLIVTALVLIGGGVAWFLHAADIADVDPRSALAVGLVVIGLGLALAAWRGRARAALIPLGFVAVAGLASAEVVGVPLDAGMGDRTVVPTRRSAVDEPIELLAGELDVDLRELPLSARRPTEVRAGVGLGELRVTVPRDVAVVAEVDVRAGEVGGELRAAPGADTDGGVLIDETYVLDGPEGAPRLDLVLDVGIGQVVVIRD